MVLEQQQEVQEKEFALCLNMIVKNESHIIKDTLTKLLKKIKFDYWVISDTGSTDKTKEIITEFFKEVGIPGELYEDEWVDFSHNRNKALEYAFGKSKYLLIFDADDEICGEFVLPKLTRDSYSFQFGSYTRPQIMNNHKRWKYFGVLHETICSADSRIDDASTEVIKGTYYVVSGRSGSRNFDSNKYLKDANILEKAYKDAVDAKDEIYNRYGFYCANSYYDCNKYEHAITWYKKTLENNGWSQEKYVSCLRLFTCYEKINNKEAGFFYLVKSSQYDKERAECYYELIKYYSCSGLYNVAYGYYGVLRDFYTNSYLKNGFNYKLFLNESISEFYLPYYVIIVSDKMRDYQTGIHMYRIIFTKKYKCFNEWFVGNLLYNLQFFINHLNEEDKSVFYLLFQEYIYFLVANNYPLFKHDDVINKYEKCGMIERLKIESGIPKEFPNWFKMTAQKNFEDFLLRLNNKSDLKFLQLGAFTGDASVWMLENVLTKEGSHLTDVDTWKGSDEKAHHMMDFNEVEQMYDSKLKYYQNVTKFKGKTIEFFHIARRDYYDFIYIDADHTATGVLLDAELFWLCLKSGGVLAFDDYEWWSDDGDDKHRPMTGIDSFIERHNEELTVICKNWQLWVIKK
jgi:predicted O-methyltransferase YrrM